MTQTEKLHAILTDMRATLKLAGFTEACENSSKYYSPHGGECVELTYTQREIIVKWSRLVARDGITRWDVIGTKSLHTLKEYRSFIQRRRLVSL